MESQRDTDMTGDSWAIDVRILLREKYTPWWGFSLAPVIGAIKWIPSYKDTKRGRRSALQIRAVILAVGIAGLVFGKELIWILAGGAVMLLAFVVPMSEVRKRTLLGRLGRIRGESTRDRETAGQLTYDGKRVSLEVDGSRERRVLVDREEHSVNIRSYQGRPCLVVGPSKGRKAETLFICAEEDVGSDVSTTGEPLERSDLDKPALVHADGWRRIRETLDAHE